MNVHVCLASWTGKHENALTIARELAPVADDLTIIYSDRDDGFELVSDFETIKVPNSWFFGKKFELSLQKCQADVLLYIDADVSCEDWPGLMERLRWAYRSGQPIGVWTPLVDYTPQTLQRTRILTLPESSLQAVCFTDSMTFALPRSIREPLLRLNCGQNTYGWGVNTVAAAIGLQQGLIPVLDESVLVRHPRGTGYSAREADRLMLEFCKRLPAHYAVYQRLIHSYAHSRHPRPFAIKAWRHLRWLMRLGRR